MQWIFLLDIDGQLTLFGSSNIKVGIVKHKNFRKFSCEEATILLFLS